MADTIEKIYQAGYEDRQYERDYDPQSHEIVYETQQLLVRNEWIDVNDKLPNNNDLVISYRERQNMVSHCVFHEGRFCSNDSTLFGMELQGGKVTHWKELPDPPINKKT